MSDDSRIVQIIPANGWFAVYAEEEFYYTRSALVCWALQKDGNIVGLDVDRAGFVTDASGAENFLGYSRSVRDSVGNRIQPDEPNWESLADDYRDRLSKK